MSSGMPKVLQAPFALSAVVPVWPSQIRDVILAVPSACVHRDAGGRLPAAKTG